MQNHESAPASPEYIPPQSQAELDKLLKQARMEGFRLGANTAAHHFNNQLGGPLNFSKLAAGSPDLPANLRALSQLSLRGIQEIIHTLGQLSNVQRLIPLENYPTILDLDKSTQPEEPNTST